MLTLLWIIALVCAIVAALRGQVVVALVIVVIALVIAGAGSGKL